MTMVSFHQIRFILGLDRVQGKKKESQGYNFFIRTMIQIGHLDERNTMVKSIFQCGEVRKSGLAISWVQLDQHP
jgi:hypothetical protein